MKVKLILCHGGNGDNTYVFNERLDHEPLHFFRTNLMNDDGHSLDLDIEGLRASKLFNVL